MSVQTTKTVPTSAPQPTDAEKSFADSAGIILLLSFGLMVSAVLVLLIAFVDNVVPFAILGTLSLVAAVGSVMYTHHSCRKVLAAQGR